MAQDSAAQSRITAGDKFPVVNMNNHRGRGLTPDEEDEDYDESADNESSIVEARLEATHGEPVRTFARFIQSANKDSRAEEVGLDKPSKITPGVKKQRSTKNGEDDGPPTPWGCEWRKSDDGWTLWRCWSEKDEATGKKIKKSRYAGYLSHEAWQRMKDYDYETFISIIGQRLRRYGKR